MSDRNEFRFDPHINRTALQWQVYFHYVCVCAVDEESSYSVYRLHMHGNLFGEFKMKMAPNKRWKNDEATHLRSVWQSAAFANYKTIRMQIITTKI